MLEFKIITTRFVALSNLKNMSVFQVSFWLAAVWLVLAGSIWNTTGLQYPVGFPPLIELW